MMMTLDEVVARAQAPQFALSALITDPNRADNPIVYVTRGFEFLTGYSAEEAIGRNCRFLQGPGTDPGVADAIARALSERLPISADILNYRKDGHAFWNRLRVRPTFGASGMLDCFVSVLKAILPDEVRDEPVVGWPD